LAELDRIEVRLRKLLQRKYYIHASLGNLRALFEHYQSRRESLSHQVKGLKRSWISYSSFADLFEATLRLRLLGLADARQQLPLFLDLIEHESGQLAAEAQLGAQEARALQRWDDRLALSRFVTEAGMSSLLRQFEKDRINLRRLQEEALIELESLPNQDMYWSRLRKRSLSSQIDRLDETGEHPLDTTVKLEREVAVRLKLTLNEINTRLGEERGRRERLLQALEDEWHQQEHLLGELTAERHRLEERLSLLEASPRQPFQPVLFQSLWPRHVRPAEWQSLLVYLASGPQGLAEVEADARRRFRTLPEIWATSASSARRPISQGTLVTIVPELPFFLFNPPAVTVLWLEDWHCVEFRMQAQPEAAPGKTFEGRVAIFVGPLLIGEIDLEVEILDADSASGMPLSEPASPLPMQSRRLAAPYRSIFVSYCHVDSEIVDRLQTAYKALGDSYFRDVEILRSGEAWSPALLAKIQDADIFQLCWSEAARASEFVEKEWRHALTMERGRFIRPMFWRKPLPPPPAELAELHFTYVEMEPSSV
jgi:hypothetical protein